jgi:hypothetical protein
VAVQNGEVVPRVSLSDLDSMRDEIGTKNFMSLKSKVPFFPPFGPNLQWFWNMARECHVWSLFQPLQCEASKGRKTVTATRVKYPLLPPDFDKTYTGAGECVWSAMCDVGVTPLQCQAREGRKTIPDTRLKCRCARFRSNLHWLWRNWRECQI